MLEAARCRPSGTISSISPCPSLITSCGPVCMQSVSAVLQCFTTMYIYIYINIHTHYSNLCQGFLCIWQSALVSSGWLRCAYLRDGEKQSDRKYVELELDAQDRFRKHMETQSLGAMDFATWITFSLLNSLLLWRQQPKELVEEGGSLSRIESLAKSIQKRTFLAAFTSKQQNWHKSQVVALPVVRTEIHI